MENLDLLMRKAFQTFLWVTYIIGRVKRAPRWMGCSIEISRDICNTCSYK